MNYESITIQDCLDNHEKRDKAAVINDRQVLDFVKEDQVYLVLAAITYIIQGKQEEWDG